MPVQGAIKTDQLPQNNFVLDVVGVPVRFTIIKFGGLDQKLQTATLPDRRKVSGGNTEAMDVDVDTPTHHTSEQDAWEKWFKDAQYPSALDYKKTCVLTMISETGLVRRSWTLTGVFPHGRKLSDFDMSNEGDMVTTSWALSIDDMVQQAGF